MRKNAAELHGTWRDKTESQPDLRVASIVILRRKPTLPMGKHLIKVKNSKLGLVGPKSLAKRQGQACKQFIGLQTITVPLRGASEAVDRKVLDDL